MASVSEEDIHAVTEWLNCFELSRSCSSLQDLCDGKILCEFLSQVSPTYFDVDNLTEVQPGGNWALILANLKKLIKNLETYFHEDLGRTADFDSVDLTLIAKDCNNAQIMNLVGLVVGAAIQCEHKAHFIQKILELPHESQAILKKLIESSMARISSLHDDDEDLLPEGNSLMDGHSRELEEALAQANTEKSMLQEQLKGLRVEVNTLRNEKEGLSHKLEEALKETELASGARASEAQGADAERTKLRKTVLDLNQNLEKLREQNENLHNEVESLHAKHESDLEVRAKMEVENRQLADELDIARARAHQASSAEAQAERYKRRLDEQAGLRQAMKELEDQNSKYLDQVLELEATVKTIKPLNDKLESYKDRAIDLEREKFDALSKLQVREAELAKTKQELESAQDAKRFFEEELISLREEKESLEASSQSGVFSESLPEMREKLARLERENRNLKETMGGEEGGGKTVEVGLLKSELEDTKRLLKERDSEALELKRKQAESGMEIQKLKEHISDMQGGGDNVPTRAETAKIQQLQQELETLRKKQDSESSAEMTVQELIKKLKEKETENNRLASDKDKLESYTKKTLHKVQEKYLVALQTCKNQLKERQDKIEALEKKIDRDKQAQKREERLLMSAVYELGMDIINTRLVSTVSEGPKSGGTAPQTGSWLNQKRQEVSRKVNPIAPG